MAITSATDSATYTSNLAASGALDKTKPSGGRSNKTEEKEEKFVQDNDTAAVYEKGDETSSVYDEKTIQQMLAESNLKTENFKKLIESLLNKQSEKFHTAYPKEDFADGKLPEDFEEKYSGKLKDFYSNLEVDDETRAQAQKDISEDGYYGVKQTSERILKFAKAIAGNDPVKLEKMYDAVKDGFKKAQEMWGDDLPEICSKTFEAVQKGFDDWRNEITAANTASQLINQAAQGALAGN